MYFNSALIKANAQSDHVFDTITCFACSKSIKCVKGYFRCPEMCAYWFCADCGNNTLDTKIKCK